MCTHHEVSRGAVQNSEAETLCTAKYVIESHVAGHVKGGEAEDK